MAREYIDELGDGTINPETSGVDSQATDNGTHVKTLAPIYYTPATIDNDGKATRETPVTIKSALDAKANDDDVVHKAGEEVITGRKIFQESVALSQYDSGENGYNAKCLGDLSVTQDLYSNWPEEAQDGHHYREWEIAVPYSVSMGEIRVTLTAMGGVLQRTIRVDSCNTTVGIFSVATNPDSLGGNNGYYTIADNDISSDFRISDLLWDSSLTGDYKFVIKIRSMHPERNVSIGSVIFETLGDTTHFEDVYIVSNDPQRVTGETYEVVRRGSVSSPTPSDGVTIVETVSWLETPKIQNYLGKDILVDGDIIQSSNNGNLSVLGTDVEVYSHPTQTAYTSKGTATKVPQITTDSTGHVTSISEVTISGVTPSSHASSATTYGIGTTSNYGHVRLAVGDMNGAENTDGVAVSKNHTHSQYAPKASPALTGTPTAPTAADGTNTTQIATTAFVQSAVTQGLSVSDAMVYKGTITLGASSPGGLTVAADKGHTYKVVANGNTKEGYVDGVKVEAGDMVICNTDSTAAATSSNYSTIAAKWDFVQGNTDGVVVGPSSAVSGNVVLFDGATGKLVKDGGTLGTAAFKDVASSGNASTTQVVMGNDTRLADARTPTSHTHGNISNDGAITSTTQSSDITIATGDKLLVTDSSNSNKVVRTGTSFDTGVTTTYLCRNGTFAHVKEADVAFGGTFRTYKSPTEAFTLQNVWFGPKPSAIVIEYSNNRTDANPTWTDYGLTDAQIGTLFSGTNFGVSINCGKAIHAHPGYTGSATYKDLSNDNIADQGLRITVCCRNYSSRSADSDYWVYCNLRRIFLRMSTQSAGNGAHCLVETLSGANFKSNTDTWNNLGDYKIQGDTGWNSIPFSSNFGGGWGQTDRPWAVRFTIWSDTLSASPNSGQTGCMAIYSIAAISDNVWYASGAKPSMQQYGTPYVMGGNGKATFADIQFTGRKLAVSLSNTSTDTSFNGSADVTNIKVSGQLADANIASAATWNAKQDALTINDSKPITIGTAAAANTVAGQAHTHDGITSVARASVTNIDISNSGTEPARMTLSQVTSQTTEGTDPGDGYVLNLLWDNAGNRDTQIYVPNSKKADKDFGHLKMRYKNESSTWGEWEYLPGAFKGTLLTGSDDLDTLYQGLPGEVLQYYWNYTNKAYSTVGKTQSGMDATTGLPTGTGTANLFVFHQSTSRTASGYVAQLMVCADIGIYYRRQFNGTWNTWTKILVATDITTDTTNKNGKITVDGTDKTVYVHPAGSAASKTGVPTANATPAFGGTFKVNQITTDATSHVSAVTERTITIPNTTGNASTAGLTKLYTASGTNTDGTMTQNAIKTALDGKANGMRWTAVTKGQTWSRLFYSAPETTVEGSNGILAVSCTRGGVVCNATFLITASHNGASKSSIIELASCDYTQVRSRLVVNSSGNYYFEVYDTANSITSSTTQRWHCTFVPLLGADVTTYTEFTDGTTIPTNYTATNDFTTTGGNAAAAIKNITRSGTTFTATRQDGSTFTFTQQDSNTDTKVKATEKANTDNANYKILATASASPTSGDATEAVYAPNITLNPSTNTISANISGNAAKVTVSEDASNELQVVGVQSSATSTLKRDSSVTVQGGAVKATTFKLGTNATITYNSTTEAIDFTFL